jgi:protease IV
MSSEKHSSFSVFFNFLKNVFFFLLILQFAPSIISSLRETAEDILYPKEQVGYLKIEGLIRDSTFYTKRIEEFEKNSSIKALLVKIDCPGGFPASSQAIFNELKKFKKKKPIIALIENVCASGAYYIASAANKIIANPSSLVGSIGVVAQIPNIKGLLDTWNIKFNYIQSGKYKTTGVPMKELSKEDTDYMQKLSDDTYNQFVNDIAQSRNLSKENYVSWADGKIFTGNQALRLKLIDQLGSFRDAVDVVKELANIKDEIKFMTLKPHSKGLVGFLIGNDDDYASSEHLASDMVATFLNNVSCKFVQKQGVKNDEIALF